MNSNSAYELLCSIDKTIVDIDTISGSSIYVDSYLAKFLVVYVCGMYEEIIENIIIDFTKRNSTKNEIVNYVKKSMDISFRNPSFDKIISTIKNLGNTEWNIEIKKSEQLSKFALDSIVNNKNSLAHGQTITLTLTEVKEYYKKSRPMFEKIDELLF